MKNFILFGFLVASVVSTHAFAKDYEAIAKYEAGSVKSQQVVNDAAVKGILAGLNKQPETQCSLEVLTSHVSGDKVLVGFFTEQNINKFVVGINCIGSEAVGQTRYDLVGRLGDGSIQIESLNMN